ncbi:MAG TPA: MFS transporter [Candidatus Limnocylindrales bacterium]|nr:MFS transporter [Candidatus Limnocylindrales bacterium]
MPGLRRGLLRNADFLKLWTGQTISVLGTQVTLLAVPILAAVTLHVSPFEFGLLTTIEFVPFLLLSLPAGVWVDRLRRRPILISADLGRAISLLSIPVAFAFDALTLWQLYVVVFVNGCLTVFFDVAYQSYLPSIVERDELVEGNAKLELTRTVSQRIGPGIAGVLIGFVTAPFALLIDAISYVVSTVLLLWIRRTEPPGSPRDETTTPRPSMRAEIVVGLRYVTGHRWLRGMALTVALGYLFATIADSILILYLVTEHRFPPGLIGLAFSIGSVGIIAGALIANRVTKAIGVGPTIVLAAVGESLSWLPVAIAPDALLFAGLTTTIVALGFFGVGWQVNAVSLRQAITPRSMQGRVNATMRFVSWSTIPLGSVLGGFLGGVIGLHSTIWLGALGSLVVFVPVALSSIWRVRDMPAPGAEPGVDAVSA